MLAMTFPIVTEIPQVLESVSADSFGHTAVRSSDSAPIRPPAGRRIVD